MKPSPARWKRRAISPVIAEVFLMAVTLIAALAVGSFAMGILGSYASSPEISASATGVPAAMAAGSRATVSSSSGGCVIGASCGQLGLTNIGTSSAVADTVVMTYGGNTYTSTLPAGVDVSAGATVYMYITALPTGARVGEMFTGYVVTSNGVSALFTGVFE